MKPFFVQVARVGHNDVWGTISADGDLAIAIGGDPRKHIEENAKAALGMMQCRGSVASSHSDHGSLVTVYRDRPKGIRITPWPAGVPIPTDVLEETN